MSRTIIIAEAGVNHNNDMGIALDLIDAAAKAGCDYIKFQSFKASKLVSPDAKIAEYQFRNINSSDQKQLSMLKSLELSHSDHLYLIQQCNLRNIKFLSTAFDHEGVFYLRKLGVDLLKSPSGEITNFPYLRSLAIANLPILLSTGMACLNEIKEALRVLYKFGVNKDFVTVLHCNTEYPTPMKDANLKAIQTLKSELGTNVGYSDHTLGIDASIAAVALGAVVIEKHITIDNNLPGPDHKSSISPHELFDLVKSIRNIELGISGDGIKKPTTSEHKNIQVVRKSIHLSQAIKEGETLTEEHLIPLRPGDGISPMHWMTLKGKKVRRNLEKFYKLDWSDLL